MIAVKNPGVQEVPSRYSEWRRFRRVFFGRRIVMAGTIVIFIFIIVAIFAPIISPYDPLETDLGNRLAKPTSQHLLGTDATGRDTLSRIIYGTRVSFMIGLVVVSIACAIGMTLGTIAGFYGGWAGLIIMRFIDALMCFPMIILAMLFAGSLGGGIKNVIIALSVAMMPVYTRMMFAQILSVKENDYILASYSIGARDLRIMWRHLVPNCLQPLLVLVTMMLGSVILAEAGLSFLGIGISAPTAAWGSMVNDGRPYLLTNPLLSFAPGIALMIVVFAFNMVGDGLRDALDPRLRGSI